MKIILHDPRQVCDILGKINDSVGEIAALYGDSQDDDDSEADSFGELEDYHFALACSLYDEFWSVVSFAVDRAPELAQI